MINRESKQINRFTDILTKLTTHETILPKQLSLTTIRNGVSSNISGRVDLREVGEIRKIDKKEKDSSQQQYNYKQKEVRQVL